MARRKDLEKFAMKHDLKIGTIEDLIRYRIENEHTVERIVEARFPTDYGEFKLYAFEDSIARELHLALVKGQIDPEKPIPVRVHVQNTLTDSLAGTAGRGWYATSCRLSIKPAPALSYFCARRKLPRPWCT